MVETSFFSKLVSFKVECACPDESCYRANRFCKLYRTWLKRHRFSRERKWMRDKKRIGGRERSLYLISFFSFRERPLLAGNRYNEPSMCDTHHLLKSWNWYSKEAWENSQHFRDTTTGFHAKWFLTNEPRNSILMTCHYPDLGNASDWSCRVGNLLFSRGNQWWGRKMLAAFPGYGNNWRIQLSINT